MVIQNPQRFLWSQDITIKKLLVLKASFESNVVCCVKILSNSHVSKTQPFKFAATKGIFESDVLCCVKIPSNSYDFKTPHWTRKLKQLQDSEIFSDIRSKKNLLRSKKNLSLSRQKVPEIFLSRFFALCFAEPVLQNDMFCQVVERGRDFTTG